MPLKEVLRSLTEFVFGRWIYMALLFVGWAASWASSNVVLRHDLNQIDSQLSALTMRIQKDEMTAIEASLALNKIKEDVAYIRGYLDKHGAK